jgi:F-type H+-transporting ATPase subunit epsilon
MAEETIEFELVSPEKLLLSEPVEMVVVPGGEGDFGVLPGHTPLLSTVRPGRIDIHNDGKVEKRIFVEGGFAEVSGERCTVLAEDARDLEEITREEAETRVREANDDLMKAESEGQRKRAERELRAAEEMLAAVDAHERERR